MQPPPVAGIVAVLAIMGTMAGTLKLLERLLRPHPEVLRKLMHVGMGLVVLTFPWLFDRPWPVVLLASVSTALLLAVKLLPQLRTGVGSILTAVKRPSLGEIYFPVSVGALFLLAGGDKLLYTVPLLILTLGDAVAALIGIRYGTVRYQTSDGMKTAEGSIAFFTVAFFSVHVPLLLFTSVGRAETLLISIILGLLAMLLEAVAWRGLDNLFIPLGAYALLKLYLVLPANALAVRLVVTVLVVAFTLAWRRRATLDDSALIACALFGYAALMVGGPQWAIAPLLFFLGYCTLWPRGDRQRFSNVYAVVTVTSTPLLCLLAYARWDRAELLLPYSLAFAAHFAFVAISTIPIFPSRLPPPVRAVRGVLGGWALVLLPVLVARPILSTGPIPALNLTRTSTDAAMALALVAAGAAAFYRVLARMNDRPRRLAVAHIAGGIIAFVVTATAASLWIPPSG